MTLRDPLRLALVGVLLVVGGCGPRVFVTTGTLIGLEASPGDGNTQPPSVTFGYKRAELALVPTAGGPATKSQVGGGSEDAYSTLAVFDLASGWFKKTKIEQFIAAGHAARTVQESPTFTNALVGASAGTDKLSNVYVALMAQEPEGACWKALHKWREDNLKDVTDFDFARQQRYEGDRTKASKDGAVTPNCRGKW
jgi:hypothetical protein